MAATVIANRDRSPLSREQMERAVPSIFAGQPHESRSSRYLYVPTIQMLDALAEEGYRPVWACQSRTRDASRQEFTKHMIRLAPADGVMLPTARGDRAEVVLVNSHDGSSSVQLSAGVFSMVCSNGLIAGRIAESFKVHHTPKWRDEIIEGTYRVLETVEPIREQVASMTGRELSEPERMLLAEHAASLRWNGETPPMAPEKLLSPRRAADRQGDAWTTLQVLQENTIRGGLPYRAQGSNGRMQFRHTRSVTGIDDLGRLNRGIWDAVATLASPNRLELARELVGRLTPEERAQLIGF